jgi:hypothetical protein
MAVTFTLFRFIEPFIGSLFFFSVRVLPLLWLVSFVLLLTVSSAAFRIVWTAAMTPTMKRPSVRHDMNIQAKSTRVLMIAKVLNIKVRHNLLCLGRDLNRLRLFS